MATPLPPAPAMPVADPVPAVAEPVSDVHAVAAKPFYQNPRFIAFALVLGALVADLMNITLVTNVIGVHTHKFGSWVLKIVPSITDPHQVGSLVLLSIAVGALGFYLTPIALRLLQKKK